MKNYRKIALVVLSVFLVGMWGCAENGVGPENVDFTGQWSGALNHPGYDSGTLTLNLVQSGETLQGTYQLSLRKRLTNGRVQVSNFGGDATGGRRSDNAGMNLALTVSGSDWICQTSLENDNSQNGTFNTPNGISGGVSLSR